MAGRGGLGLAAFLGAGEMRMSEDAARTEAGDGCFGCGQRNDHFLRINHLRRLIYLSVTTKNTTIATTSTMRERCRTTF